MVHTCDRPEESQSDESISPQSNTKLLSNESQGRFTISSWCIIANHRTMLTNKKAYYCNSVVRASSDLLAPVKVLVIIQTLCGCHHLTRPQTHHLWSLITEHVMLAQETRRVWGRSVCGLRVAAWQIKSWLIMWPAASAASAPCSPAHNRNCNRAWHGPGLRVWGGMKT